MSDAFKDRLSERARETGRPALGNQCQGRPLTPAEDAFADALMAIYGTGQHDFTAVAERLAERAVVAPISGRTDWDLALLEAELKAINADLDAAYAEAGYGA